MLPLLLACFMSLQPVFLPRPVHVLVAAPAGAGKSTSFAIPNAIAWPQALVTLDVKGEIYQAAAAERAARGRRQVRLDPFGLLGPGGDTLNVLAHLDPHSPLFLPEIEVLAEALVIKNPQEKEPHWSESAEIWLAALLADVVRHFPPAERNLQTLRGVMTDGALHAQAIDRLVRSADPFLRRKGGTLLNYSGKELLSTLTSLNRHVRFLDDPLVARFTERSSFDSRALLDGDIDVWFVLAPQYLRSHGRLARLVITSLLRTIVAAGVERHREILFLLDEFAALGQMEILLDAVSQFRDFGVRMCMIVQALAQLEAMFPDGQHQVVLANTDKLCIGVRDYPLAELLSKIIGETTVHTENTQVSGGRSSSQGQGYSEGSNSGWSRGVSDVGRPLMRPEEALAAGSDLALVLARDLPPLLVQTCPYYADPAFRPAAASVGWHELARCVTCLLFALIAAVAAIQWRHHTDRRAIPEWPHPPANRGQIDPIGLSPPVRPAAPTGATHHALPRSPQSTNPRR